MLRAIVVLINRLCILCNIHIFISIRTALGDHLCLTSILSELKKNKIGQIILITNNKYIFLNNDDIDVLITLDNHLLKSFIFRVFKRIQGTNIHMFQFYDKKLTQDEYMRNKHEKIHLTRLHSLHWKIPLSYKYLPKIVFSQDEVERYDKKFKQLGNYSLVQSTGKITYTPNKEWNPQYFNQVVKDCSNINWVQVGLESDTRLDNVIDLCGKTELRELFYLVSNATFILASEGLLNHIAAVFCVKSYVVFSGFSDKSLVDYPSMQAIENNNKPICFPCWKREYCEDKICMDEITPTFVSEIIKNDFSHISK